MAHWIIGRLNGKAAASRSSLATTLVALGTLVFASAASAQTVAAEQPGLFDEAAKPSNLASRPIQRQGRGR